MNDADKLAAAILTVGRYLSDRTKAPKATREEWVAEYEAILEALGRPDDKRPDELRDPPLR